MVSRIRQDIGFAVRMFAGSRGSTAIALGTLGLAIGFSTATYSVVHRILVRPLPIPQAERLVDVGLVTAETRAGRAGQMPRYGAYTAWREHSTLFEDLGAYELAHPVLGAEVPKRVSVAGVEPQLLTFVGARPMLGRLFSPEEDIAAGVTPVILSAAFWADRFGGDPGAIGRVLMLDTRPHRVIGVLPDDFRFPVLPPAMGLRPIQAWTPLASVLPSDPGQRDMAAVWVVGRVRSGVTLANVETELDRISTERVSFDSDDPWRFVRVSSLQEFVVGDLRQPLLLILGAAVFVLLVSCANTANLLLARGVAREQEFALRIALGASRGRLMQQLLTESVLLALVGGIFGVLLAAHSVPLLVELAGDELPELGRFGVDSAVLSIALAVTSLIGILFGLAAGLHASRSGPAAALVGSRRVGRSPWRKRATDGLVVAEVALTMTLLAGAGVLINSFARAVRVDLGFDSRRVIVAQLVLPSERYPSESEQLAFARSALAAVQSISGVSAAAVATSSPFAGGSFSVVNVPGTRTRLGARPAWLVATTPDYFRVLGIPLLRGQTLDPSTPDAILIDDAGARELFPETEPVGKSIAWRLDRNRGTVVGIAGSAHQSSPLETPRPHIYMPLTAGIARSLGILVRTESDPRRFTSAIRGAIADIDATLVVDPVVALAELVDESLGRQRFYMYLLGVFAGCSLLIAIGGIYATVSFAAAGAVRELGVRAALGARQPDLLALVARRGLVLTGAGGGIGLIGAFATTRLLEGLLFDVSPADPLTFGAVFLLLSISGLVATYLPARGAMRADPMVALRRE